MGGGQDGGGVAAHPYRGGPTRGRCAAESGADAPPLRVWRPAPPSIGAPALLPPRDPRPTAPPLSATVPARVFIPAPAPASAPVVFVSCRRTVWGGGGGSCLAGWRYLQVRCCGVLLPGRAGTGGGAGGREGGREEGGRQRGRPDLCVPAALSRPRRQGAGVAGQRPRRARGGRVWAPPAAAAPPPRARLAGDLHGPRRRINHPPTRLVADVGPCRATSFPATLWSLFPPTDLPTRPPPAFSILGIPSCRPRCTFAPSLYSCFTHHPCLPCI